MEKGIKAFVSFIRAYKEHHCSYIFRLVLFKASQSFSNYLFVLDDCQPMTLLFKLFSLLKVERPRGREISNGIWLATNPFDVRG